MRTIVVLVRRRVFFYSSAASTWWCVWVILQWTFCGGCVTVYKILRARQGRFCTTGRDVSSWLRWQTRWLCSFNASELALTATPSLKGRWRALLIVMCLCQVERGSPMIPIAVEDAMRTFSLCPCLGAVSDPAEDNRTISKWLQKTVQISNGCCF